MANSEINSCSLARTRFESWDNDSVHRSRKYRAAYNDCVVSRLYPERLSDLLADPPNVAQVKISIGLARSADAHEGQLSVADGYHGVGRCAQESRSHPPCNDLINILFNDWRVPLIDQVHLGLDRINPDDFVTILR